MWIESSNCSRRIVAYLLGKNILGIIISLLIEIILNPARRKSNCVKEVEKIKQKRDDRRAAHMAIKEQYESHFDTSDPNWEFLAMIK